MTHASLDHSITESLLKIGREDPPFLPELRALYEKQYRERSPEIERMAAAGELVGIAAVTHVIRSASGTLGALRFCELCATLERSALAGDSQAVAAQLPAFQEAFARVNEAIKLRFR